MPSTYHLHLHDSVHASPIRLLRTCQSYSTQCHLQHPRKRQQSLEHLLKPTSVEIMVRQPTCNLELPCLFQPFERKLKLIITCMLSRATASRHNLAPYKRFRQPDCTATKLAAECKPCECFV